MSREDDLALVREYTKSESLIRHMLAVEAAMRAYAKHFNEDVEMWAPQVDASMQSIHSPKPVFFIR